jgi:hypothetical protein
VNKEIQFEDIRKGDIVKTVRTFDDGFILTKQGEATTLTGDRTGWYHKSTGHCVAAKRYGLDADDRYYLIERVEPKDHLVFEVIDGKATKLGDFDLKTKTEAQERAESLTGQPHYIKAGRIFRAVRVEV